MVKKIFALMLALTFVFLFSTNILAVPESDIQYSIHDTPPSLNAYFHDDLDNLLYPSFELVYYKNPETYADVDVSRNSLYLAGSYLTESGLFLESVFVKDFYSYFKLTPGFRYNFSKSNYAAIRVTYYKDLEFDYQSLEYNGYGKYSDEKTRLTGGFIFNKNGHIEYVSINRLISDGLIASGGVRLEEVNNFGFLGSLYSGLSYYNDTFVTNLTANLPNLIYYKSFNFEPYLEANALGYIGNLGLGIGYSLRLDEHQWNQDFYLKGKYLLSASKDSRVNLYFRPLSKIITLSWIQTL